MIASNLLLCKESALGFDGPEKEREKSLKEAITAIE